MSKTTATGVVAIAALALGLTLVGCGSDTKTAISSSTGTSSPSKPASTTKPPATSRTTAAGPNKTIADYIKANGILETQVNQGDPGSPTIDLPIPAGWEPAGQDKPDFAYGAIVYTKPASAADPPTILAILSKLTGNVDPQQVLNFAPGELLNLPKYDGPPPETSSLGDYPAVAQRGNYEQNAAPRLVAQKTVVIPGPNGLYVLQLNADGPENEAQTLLDAFAIIDSQTTITF